MLLGLALTGGYFVRNGGRSCVLHRQLLCFSRNIVFGLSEGEVNLPCLEGDLALGIENLDALDCSVRDKAIAAHRAVQRSVLPAIRTSAINDVEFSARSSSLLRRSWRDTAVVSVQCFLQSLS